MIAHRIFLVIILISGLFNYTYAKPVGENGLSLDLVATDIGAGAESTCALRDKYGFLWVGTKNGLQCFDGNGRSAYRANSEPLRGISNLHVSSLYESGDDIWIGSNDGLYVFDRRSNTISRFPYKTSYGVTLSSLIDKMIDTGQGRTWISTHGQGFFIFNKQDSTLIQNSRHGAYYSDMTIGVNGLIYLASINGQIQAFRPNGEFVSQSRLPDYISDKIGISVEASGQDIWVASGPNLYRLDSATGIIEKVLTNATSSTINTLQARTDGSLLLGTNNGIWSFNTISRGNLTHLIPDSSSDIITDIRVADIFSDYNNDILIIHPSGPIEALTQGSSAFRFIPLTHHSSDNGYNFVRSIAADKDHNGVWIGSDNGLEFYDITTGKFDGNKVPAIGAKTVTALLADGDCLWIGTLMSGIYLHDIKTGTTHHFVYDENTPNTLISNEINCIYCAHNHDIHILTNWGMCRYDAAADNFPQLVEFGQQIRGVTMQEDSLKGGWISTANNGLYYRSPEGKRFDAVSAIDKTHPVKMMHLDHKGRLWAASHNDGLYLYDYDSGKFSPYNISLLNNKPVTFISDDKNETLWIGASDMLLKLDDGDDITIYNFDRHDEWIPASGVVETLWDGKMVIGCSKGFLIFDTNKIKTYDDKIKVYPQYLSLPSLEDDSDELARLGLNTLLYTRESVTLPYSDNTFTIHLSAIRPTQISDVRYDYMLEGIDKSWVTGVTLPEVTYNNLHPGKFRFLLRPHGVKNAAISVLPVTILPPWYRTVWAYITYLVLTMLVILMTYDMVKKIYRRKYQRQLNDLRIQKEREVFEAKTRYFVDLVHEIRTPLMLISMPLEQLAEDVKGGATPESKEKRPKYIKSMQRNIDYLLGITNQLLDFRRAENESEIQLNLSRCDVNRLITDICHRFDEPLTISGKKIDLTLPDHDVTAVIDIDKTERVLMNLIGNAMKYATGSIRIIVDDNADEVRLTIADDGPGIPAEERERIFDAYYQIGNDNVAASLGTGLGLAYSKLIAVAHKGDIRVDDNPCGGAMFTMTLPKGDINTSDTTNDVTGDTTNVIIREDQVIRGKTILLVEDNTDLRDMITDALGSYYNVITAADGVLALDILAANDVDVIVSDVMMPRMDGLELCRRIKSNIEYSHIPFIILSAKTGQEAREEGMECGADVYLEKPFPIKELLYLISNQLHTRQQLCKQMLESSGVKTVEKSDENPLQSSGLNRMDTEFLEKMNDIIARSIADEEFSIDLLSEKLNMSRSSFYRKITAVTGISPSDYLKNFRLNHAAQLLCDGCRVTEVAARVGFTSSSYFAKCFKDKFGVSPSEYVASQNQISYLPS